MTTLKEKGKRLIICDRLDWEFRKHCRDFEEQIKFEYDGLEFSDDD